MSKIGVFTHVWPWEIIVIADLGTVLIALYVEPAGRIIAPPGLDRSGPGQRPEVTGAGLAGLAVAQVLLRYDDERRWLRAAALRAGRLFPRLLAQGEYNQRVRAAGPLMEAALRWLAGARQPAPGCCGRPMPPPSRAGSPRSRPAVLTI